MTLKSYPSLFCRIFRVQFATFTNEIDNWPRRLCMRHQRWRLQCATDHCYYQLLAQAALRSRWRLHHFFFSSGKLPRLKICFPQYFDIEDICKRKKKNYEKNWFFDVFSALYGQCWVTAAWATVVPWVYLSKYYFCQSLLLQTSVFKKHFVINRISGPYSRLPHFTRPNCLLRSQSKDLSFT